MSSSDPIPESSALQPQTDAIPAASPPDRPENASSDSLMGKPQRVIPARLRFYVAGVFAALALIGVYIHIDPAWAKWTLIGVALFGVFFIFVYGRHYDANEETETHRQRRITRVESHILKKKQKRLQSVIMAYAEQQEFPQFSKLRDLNWQSDAWQKRDREIEEMIDREVEASFKRFSKGEYWPDDHFDASIMLHHVLEFSGAIAKKCRPDSAQPMLELDLESVLKAVNRASIQVILLMEGMSIPGFDVKTMNLKKVASVLQKASAGFDLYKRAEDLLGGLGYLYQGGKFFLWSNPFMALASIVAGEALWYGAGKFLKGQLSAYSLTFIKQVLSIIAWETVGIYDSSYRYRNRDWVYGIELAHLLSKVDESADTLRDALQELGSLELRSSYDRIFLYRCVAHNVSPKPKDFVSSKLFSESDRRAIYDRLEWFRNAHLQEKGAALDKGSNLSLDKKSAQASAKLSAVATKQWRSSIQERLGLKIDQEELEKYDDLKGPPKEGLRTRAGKLVQSTFRRINPKNLLPKRKKSGSEIKPTEQSGPSSRDQSDS